MNSNFLLTFFIALGVYILGVIVFVVIKKHLYNKNYKKELKEKGNEHEKQQD